jgi:hypothetical protein
MLLKARFVLLPQLLGAICMIVPASGTVFTYAGNAPASFGITLNTSLSGAGLVNLAPGTNISGSIIALTFSGPHAPPPADTGGFPIGGGVGSGYLSFGLVTAQIGTNALGRITSWNFTETMFASYPAVAGENPNDFFCNYTVSSTSSTDSATLTLDNDAGFCPGSVSGAANPTGWGAGVASAPEPETYALIGAGLLGFSVLTARRKRSSRRTA